MATVRSRAASTHPGVAPGLRLVLLVGAMLVLTLACEDETGDPFGPVEDPATGSVEVATSTTGSGLDPDGYTILIDGEPGPSIGINATSTLTTLTEGEHEVELHGIASNCVATAVNPRTVTVVGGESVTAVFTVSCENPSTSVDIVTLTTAATPLDLDPDGYEIWIDGRRNRTIGIDGTVIVDLTEGPHEIELKDVDAACSVVGTNPTTLTVEAKTGAEARPELRFEVGCAFVLREIVFTRYGSIVLMAADGSSPRPLTDSISATTPVWSPDGSKIAFGPELWCWFECDIRVMSADGGNVVDLTTTGTNDGPAWSPDGSRIAFTSWRSGNDDVYVMDADGSSQVRLTAEPSAEGSPAWSPDGSRIAYVSDWNGNADVYVMNADGSNATRLTFNPRFDGDPAWSPDGSTIAFTSDRNGNADVYVMNPDGSKLIRLTYEPDYEGQPSWSPDGSRIAFLRRGDIYVMDADGSDQTNLTNDPAFDMQPDWRR